MGFLMIKSTCEHYQTIYFCSQKWNQWVELPIQRPEELRVNKHLGVWMRKIWRTTSKKSSSSSVFQHQSCLGNVTRLDSIFYYLKSIDIWSNIVDQYNSEPLSGRPDIEVPHHSDVSYCYKGLNKVTSVLISLSG